jgi:putative ABC transport system ATP-binding protein
LFLESGFMTNENGTAASSVVLETRGLTKTYGQGETLVEALKQVDVRIERGEIVAIMGPSGSGKSTLLTLLGAVDTPTAGEVWLEGVDLATLNDTQRTLIRRHRVGFIFQAFNLLPILTALENVSLPLELDGVPTRTARSRAVAALEQVGMVSRKDHLPSMLSGGEQQRVAIARALAIEPALLLADEPTGNLDRTNGQRIIKLLRSLQTDHHQTIVMVTHDEQVGAVADRIVRLVDGRVASVETPQPH